MTDYHPLIARAVEGLGKSTGEARRALYERARTALVTQLRGVEPALPESEITKERLALEEAIRKVEAEAARKTRTESRTELRPESPAEPHRRERPSPPSAEARTGRSEKQRPETNWPKPILGEPTPAQTPSRTGPLTARERLLSGRTSSLSRDAVKDFRDVVGELHEIGGATAKAAQSARDTRDSYGAGSQQRFPLPDEPAATPLNDHFEPRAEAEEWSPPDYNARQARSFEPSSGDWEDEQPAMPLSARPQPPRSAAPAEEYEMPRPARSYRGLARLIAAVIIIVGVVAIISWQWSSITGLYHFFADSGARQSGQTTQAPTAEPKFAGRVPQEQSSSQAPPVGAPGSQTAPQVAQRVVLYEEDPKDPQGRRYAGSAIWRTETVSPGAGLAPELAVRADLEIPDRRMTVTFSLRRNTDKALPASHTIEIMFNLPADFPGGGIANVPGILMKQSEQARGTPLAGLAVKVTNGFFLVGLSAVDTDMQRNISLLKERPWFDIPVVYTNGGRAIMAMEKGPPGDRAFADAFAAWEKK